jgi:hypothetical protein
MGIKWDRVASCTIMLFSGWCSYLFLVVHLKWAAIMNDFIYKFSNTMRHNGLIEMHYTIVNYTIYGVYTSTRYKSMLHANGICHQTRSVRPD